MERLHYTRFTVPDFMVDDFGTRIQVIPGEHCRIEFANEDQVVINSDSWHLLIALMETPI